MVDATPRIASGAGAIQPIHALGKEAASTLGGATVVLEEHPAAMQLPVLSTKAEVSAERNSRLMCPLPIELMRLHDALCGLGVVREPEASGR